MSDGSIPAEVDWASREIQKGEDVDLTAVRLLIDHSSPSVDPSLLAIVAAKGTKFDVAALASRILVERNPDRDPAYLSARFPAILEASGRVPAMRSSLSFFGADSPVYAFSFGFARLRQLNPIQVDSVLLEHKSVLVRSLAAANLGETLDLDALTPLVKALADSRHRVRKNAADSIRRLRHAGAAAVLPTHPVRDGLIGCLSDRRRVVRVAAARALGSMGDVRPLREHRARVSWLGWRRRRDLDEVLRGEIPPLPKIWPGDETT